jgi:hypothetical protein
MPCLPSRSSARWPSPCSGVMSSWLSKWVLWSFRLSSSSHCASWPSRCCLFRSSKGPHVDSSALSQLFRFSLVELFYVGLGLGSGSMSAVAYQLGTPFTVLLAWPLLAERPSLTTSAGVVLAFVGVVVLAAGPGLSANALSLLLVVGAALAFAVSNVLTKRYGHFDPLMLMGWSSLLTVPQVMLMSSLLEHGQLASLITADERGWLALANFHRRNCWVWPLVLADCPLLHGPRRTIRPTASGVRLDFERVVPWRSYDPKVDCRWAARDLRGRHYTSKIVRSTNLNPEVASWRLPGF